MLLHPTTQQLTRLPRKFIATLLKTQKSFQRQRAQLRSQLTSHCRVGSAGSCTTESRQRPLEARASAPSQACRVPIPAPLTSGAATGRDAAPTLKAETVNTRRWTTMPALLTCGATGRCSYNFQNGDRGYSKVDYYTRPSHVQSIASRFKEVAHILPVSGTAGNNIVRSLGYGPTTLGYVTGASIQSPHYHQR